MSVSQGIDLCEMYEKVSAECGKRPPLWLSFIAGIYDEILHKPALSRDHHRWRGASPQALHGDDGGDQVVTINWKGAADLLLEQDPDVVHRFHCHVPPLVIDELLEKLPDFRRGWVPGALRAEEYEEFGPVVLFRSMFLKS